MQVSHLEIPLTLGHGQKAMLFIYPTSDNALLFDVDDASRHGEARWQLVEGKEYEYEIASESNDCLQFELCEDIIRPSRRHPSSGIIRTGIYVGTLSLSVVQISTVVCKIELEVQSIKSDYRSDYHTMMENITEYYTDLLMMQGSPVTQRFEVDFDNSAETLYQKFAFVKSLIEGDTFHDAVRKVVSNPVHKWIETTANQNITNTRRLNRCQLRQLITATDRVKTPDRLANKLPNKLQTLPRMLTVSSKEVTIDIFENQFVKFVLSLFLSFCNNLYTLPKASERLKKEARLTAENIASTLGQSFFRHISQPLHLNLNSPILQRKEGYREVLQSWLMFDLAAKLSWQGGDNVYQAGKRNVAALYEYWVFFKLMEVIGEIFHIKPNSKSALVSTDENGINLELKQGRMTVIEGVCQTEGRKLNLRFYYNRTFSKTDGIDKAGSWTTTMRPDYTLSIWPGDYPDETYPEKEDLITHIHFDAKYRLDKIVINEDVTSDELLREKDEQEIGKYKRADLLKMHSYKDAIRRTSGAYVLYPGNIGSTSIKGYHEVIPGLGAFCLSPAHVDSDIKALKEFLIEVKEHLLDRASQREQMALHSYETYRNNTKQNVMEDMPEPQGITRNRLPFNVSVLIGTYHSKEQLDWIKRTHLYNFRAGARKGSLNLNPDVVASRYLLVKHGKRTNLFFKLSDNGPIVMTRHELITKKGYPQHRLSDGTVDLEQEKKEADNIYLVYELQEAESQFLKYKWDVVDLEEFLGNKSSKPDSIMLDDLMRLSKKE